MYWFYGPIAVAVLGVLFAAWRADHHGARRRLGIKPPENDDAIGPGKVEINRRNTQGLGPGWGP